MCRRPFAASDLHHSLKSKYCKKIFNFVTVSKFSFLFNKIRIHNGSFNIKTAFLPFTVFLENIKCVDHIVSDVTLEAFAEA